jgi:arylsulfatase A-like enzyme
MDRSGTAYAVALVSSFGTNGAADRVPILLWRPGMAPAERADSVAVADLVPTLAAMLGLPAPSNAGGKCLAGIEGITCPAP